MTNPLAQMNKINDICIYVEDFQAAIKFFTEVFGFTVKRLQPTPETANYAEFDFQGTTSLSIWERAAVQRDAIPAEVLGGIGHRYMIAIKVPSVDDVTAICAELADRGATIVKEPTDYEFGSRAGYVLDCEGNIWEVFAWFEGNGPGLLADLPQDADNASDEAQ